MDEILVPQVYIFELDELVQVALADSLCRLADSAGCDTEPIMKAVDAFADIMRFNVSTATGSFARGCGVRSVPILVVDSGTTTQRFLSDAVLAGLGFDACSGPLLLGAERWGRVRSRFHDIFASKADTSVAPQAEPGVEPGAAEDAMLTKFLAYPMLRCTRFGSACLSAIRRTHAHFRKIVKKLTERPAATEFTVGSPIREFPARSAPAHPEISRLVEGPARHPHAPDFATGRRPDPRAAHTRAGDIQCIHCAGKLKGRRREDRKVQLRRETK